VRPIEKVYNALDRHDCNPRGEPNSRRQIEARCPAHDDRTASLSLSEGDDDRALVKCFAGCTAADIVTALHLEWEDLFPEKPERRTPAPPLREVCTYDYHDAEGAVLFQVVRFEPKTFRQRRKTPTGWEWGLGDTPRVLYRLPEVIAARERGDYIFVCEGEKDADAVRAEGKCGTTLPMGAGKWRPEYTAQLTGANVVLLADDDEPGRKHAAEVYRALYGKAHKLGVRLPREGAKDISDHLAAGASLNGGLRKCPELQELAGPKPTGRSALTAAAFASRKTADSPVLGPLLQRGMRTVIGAQTGEGKTTLSLQAIAALTEGRAFFDWSPRGRGRALVVDLEQGEVTLQMRLRESGLSESERVDVLWEPNGIALDKREEDRAMVRDILRDGGYDMVLLDPLYQLHLGSGNDESVAAETMRIVDGWAREFNCCLLLPMHMRKPHPDAGKNITIHDIAGVGTWLRNAEFVLGLQVMSAGQSRLHFFKDRIGRGPTIRSFWWLDFDREAGFRRNFHEERLTANKELKALVTREEGASLDELLAVRGAVAPDAEYVGVGSIKSLLKGCDERNGRYYKRKPKPKADAAVIPGQTVLSTDGMT
jgi:5S rRNA maturation endonuclease (ribonuclease M5)